MGDVYGVCDAVLVAKLLRNFACRGLRAPEPRGIVGARERRIERRGLGPSSGTAAPNTSVAKRCS